MMPRAERRPQKKKRRANDPEFREINRRSIERNHEDCPTGKRGYRSRVAAERAFDRALVEREREEDKPKRIYECPHCLKFHLTKLATWMEAVDGPG